MPAARNQIGSALFQSLSNKIPNRQFHPSAVTDDSSSFLYIASSRILDTNIEFEMLDHKPSMLTQMKNNCVMLLQNGCSKKEMIKKNERMNGDVNKIPHLPTPKVILYPPERVQLGWQDKKMLVGSGLDNPGVICYINSTLQALFHIPAFTNWLMSDEQHQKTCQQKSGVQKDCIVCMVCDTFLMSQKHTGSSFKASMITSRLYLICKHLSTYRQEDAHEFLRYLIESMERCYLSVLGHAAKSLDSYSRETTPINQIFGGYIRTQVTCGKCGHISTTFQHFQDLILDIRQSDNVNEALDNYFEKEPLDESYVCERCRRQVMADKQFSIEKAPNVLCIQLKRYNVGMGGLSGSKNSKAMYINERLDLSNYRFNYHKLKNDARPLRYRLVSMVIHFGSSLNSGHYTALGLTPSGSYYYFNDSNVYQTTFKNYSTSNDSYIIFYELEPLRNIHNVNVESKSSTVTSSSTLQLFSNSNNKQSVNGYFSNKTNGVTKPLNGITKSLNGINIIKKDKKSQLYEKWDSNSKLFKQGQPKDKSQNDVSLNSSTKSESSTTNGENNTKKVNIKDKKIQIYNEWDSNMKNFKAGQPKDKSQTETSLSRSNKFSNLENVAKPLSIYQSLVPYIDSDKEVSDVESSSLSGEDNGSPVEKVNHSPDQKVPDKRVLVMRPEEDSSDENNEETPPKKCYVLKPQNDNSPLSEQEKEILPTQKCLVLKPTDDYTGVHVYSSSGEVHSVKKCCVRIPKDDCEANTSKSSYLIEEKCVEKKNCCRENGVFDSDNNKSKIKVDQNIYDGNNSPSDCKTNGRLSNGNSSEEKARSKYSNGSNHKHSKGTKNWPKFTNDFHTIGHNKSNGNSFKESMKSRTHMGFGGDVKTWNGEKSFVDRETEQERHRGMKRSFDDEYNEDFDRGVVKKKFDNEPRQAKESGFNTLQGLRNELKQYNGKMGRNRITWVNRCKTYRHPYNNGYRHNGNGGGYKNPRYNNDRRFWPKQR